ncbi:DUF3046 domain-containing protein [Microbacterium invictum]|uniref:Signal transduction histidine kinase n=1 Tax=Microbacterium invictum TaxID=515415 RepID=A0AA40SNK9_9MICO|nr:DUF3046 domain-containing protein [Microbacterium invictum]MBB4139526.1 hypothetical protein [Microbacterium invictum]
MRLSEFERAVEHEFGAGGATLVADLTLSQLAHRTAAECLGAGVPPREIWRALCVEADVPLARRHGVGLQDPPRD